MYYVIGKVPGYNNIIDPDNKYRDSLLSKLTIVDMSPVSIKADLTRDAFKELVKKFSLNEIFDATNAMAFFDSVIQANSEYVKYYKGQYDGIRIIANSDSAINLNVSHDYNIAPIEQQRQNAESNTYVDKMKQTARTAGALLQNVDQNASRQAMGESGVLDYMFNRHVNTPNFWSDTTTGNILQLSIKLFSPYGDPESVQRYIIDPLIMLYIMGSPLTATGGAYSAPFAYEVDAHGTGYYKLAGITSLNIDRGGPDMMYNVYHQPLSVTVRMTIQPLALEMFTATGIAAPASEVYDKAFIETPKTIYESFQASNKIQDIIDRSKNAYH